MNSTAEEWADDSDNIVKRFDDDMFIEHYVDDFHDGYIVSIEGSGFGLYDTFEAADEIATETYDKAKRLERSLLEVWEHDFVEEIKQKIAEDARKACSNLIGQANESRKTSSGENELG